MEDARYIAIEGPIGVGKALLADKMAHSLGSRLVTAENEANPFLEGFYKDPQRYAFQTQLFFILSRFKQQRELAQLDLFHRGTVSDYLFERDRIFAQINLSEDELGLYDQVFGLLKERSLPPDLVVYLSVRTDILKKRLKDYRSGGAPLDPGYIEKLNERFHQFFFHYNEAPLLVVNASEADFINDDEEYERLLTEVQRHRKGVKHYVPVKELDEGLKGLT